MFRRYFNSVWKELLITFLFIFIIYNFIGTVDTTIKADGKGYYDYLPSIFIHHDLVRHDKPLNTGDSIYNRIQTFQYYLPYGEYKVNKYACGTSVLLLPFFTATYFLTDLENHSMDGYEKPFQKMVFYAALFYLFLSLFFLKKVLELYQVNEYIITFLQLLLALATGVTNYANYDPAFSHVYSLFTITTFIYFVRLYFTGKNLNHFLIACLLLGLILILRQVNVLILLFVPFLAGSWDSLKKGVLNVIRRPAQLFAGILAVVGVFFIQMLLWYLQTGDFFVYSYQGEGFNFSDPHFTDILFSYEKGLFVYAPVLFFAVPGLAWMTYKRNYYQVLTWLLFFLVLTYILSSWHAWYYGACYGLRAYIDFYAVFFIPFALMLKGAGIPLKVIMIGLSLLTIPLNLIQTYQYKNYILHWRYMDKEKYWKVFLRTNQRFKGLLWKDEVTDYKFQAVKEVELGDFLITGQKDSIIYREYSSAVPDFNKVKIVQVLLDNDFDAKNDTKIILSISDSSYTKNHYWLDKNLVLFCEKDLNEWHTGMYPYVIKPFTDKNVKYITLTVRPGDQPNDLRNVKIRYFLQIK